MKKPSQSNAIKINTPDPDIVAHNTALLSPKNIVETLRRKSGSITNNVMSQTLNVLAHKLTGKIEKIGTQLLDTKNPNMIDVYVTVKTKFDLALKTTVSTKLELEANNELSHDAMSVILASLKKVSKIK